MTFGTGDRNNDWQFCPGCDAQLPASLFCKACQTYPSDWSQVTLTEWNERNPEVVREIKAWLNQPYVELKRTGTGGWL